MNIVDRFLNYTRINTTTDREKGAAGIMPSSPGQMELALWVKQELEQLGLQDIELRETAILTATLPANMTKQIPTVSFFGHLDTSAEQKNDTHAHIVNYQGGDICLNPELDIILKASEFPEIAQYVDQEIIVTDGTSLLGADDKAAIAAILDALQYLQDHPEIEHGPVKVGFVPDEEQGLRGAKAFDVDSFGADFGYTLDCCGIGEFVYENWNAGNAEVTFIGQSAHPMSAKGKLKNSLLMAHKFIAMLPPGEAPEYTEGREGYYWVKELSGNSAKTVLKMDIRDFTKEGYRQRMTFLQQLADSCKTLWGENAIEIDLSDRYENVANSLEGEAHFPVDIAKEAYKRNNIEMKVTPMRGGYDGAVLSQKGLPCPNIFTGAHNFHSIYEYLPVNSLQAASDVVVEVIKITAEKMAK
ncbi:peptidase T [Photobacterium damselae subsp. damselae]|uniref:peptidase T n=1 Tax=Photobacterium damselae TaxID=38293 RepID=UPI001EEDB385|nr:peptidase T [Photobacterium damselae]UKA02979.1 peptidase T [Photobacterium damselae subsp. damselae]BDR34137.1 peptidase T [Photobacterium damselae subsp. damselae]